MGARLDLPEAARARPIARLVAVGFLAVSIVAVLTFGWLIVQTRAAAAQVEHMRHDEAAIEQSQRLAAAVREQYAHIAHAIIDADASSLDGYERARVAVQTGVQQLGAVAPESERWRVEELGSATQALHSHFTQVVVPLIRADRPRAVRAEHQELQALATQAGTHADELARAVEGRMASAHVAATRATTRGLIGGGIGAAVLLGLALLFTLRVRSALLAPLAALTQAVRRFGEGQVDARFASPGHGEIGALGVAFDRMADELQAREQALVRSERMAATGQLAAGVAHELNNPIGIIRGYLKTMDPHGDRQVLADELRILDEEAEACQRIAEDLLAFAQPGALQRRATPVHELLRTTAARFADSTGRSLDVQVDQAELHIDPERLRQVLLNLLRNAEAATPSGGEIALYGRSIKEKARYRIEVHDAGAGIPPSDRDHIFEPFFSTRPGGTGLGLSVCAGIVGAHGGTLSAHDSPLGGAALRIELPIGLQDRP